MALAGARAEDKAAAAAVVNQAEGALMEVQGYLSELYLTAPCDGIVSAIYPKVGELVGQGAPIMSITDMNEVIYGRTAHIHGHLIGCYGLEFFFFLRQCIIDFNHFHSYLALRIPGTTRTSGTGSCL